MILRVSTDDKSVAEGFYFGLGVGGARADAIDVQGVAKDESTNHALRVCRVRWDI